MFPLRDVIPSRTFPVVTVAIVSLNALAFLFELSLRPRALEIFLVTYGLVPAQFSWATAFTSMFLHGGWAHVIGNMWSLWIFGDNVEDRLGHGRYLAFYLGCGAFAALAHTWSAPSSIVPTIGASGAVAAVMGGYLVLYPHSRVLTVIPPLIFSVFEIPAVVFLGFWFLLQLVSGVGTQLAATTGEPVGGIAFWAHVAGFAAGAALVHVLARPERGEPDWWYVR